MNNQDFITIEHKEITKDYVFFTSSCTTYANIRRVPTYDIKELLKRCTVVCKQLKEHGCKVSHKNKSRKELTDNIEQYTKEIQDYTHNFDMLVNYATWINSKPLPVGTSDNEELNTMYEFRNACMTATNRNKMISKVLEFANRLDELENHLQCGECKYSAIYF